MLQDLPGYITSALLENRELLPRNPQLARQIQDKIALLQNANLLNEITQGQFWSEGTAVSLNGRTVPIVAIFPVGTMRNSASQAVSVLEQAVPVLETFLQIAFPPDVIRLWYGFKIGASGAGGVLYLEDRETYEARWFPGLVLYEPMVVHELSHTYVLHEGLNQFLELYGYNVVRSSSQNVQAWTFTRDYVAGRGSNDGVHALLDVYQWIGPQAMSNAYRTIYGIRPPYGQPLSSECRQAFVDQAPTALKAQVAEKMAKVVY